MTQERRTKGGPVHMPPAGDDAKVDASWSIDETRNAWMRIVGVG